MNKAWRPSDEYVKPQDRPAPAAQCEQGACRLLDKALTWLPVLFALSAILLLLQA